MELLELFRWEVVAPYADKYLKQAQEENDDNWFWDRIIKEIEFEGINFKCPNKVDEFLTKILLY